MLQTCYEEAKKLITKGTYIIRLARMFLGLGVPFLHCSISEASKHTRIIAYLQSFIKLHQQDCMLPLSSTSPGPSPKRPTVVDVELDVFVVLVVEDTVVEEEVVLVLVTLVLLLVRLVLVVDVLVIVLELELVPDPTQKLKKKKNTPMAPQSSVRDVRLESRWTS